MLKRLEQILERKDRLLKRKMFCIKCSSEQVQLYDYIYPPAKYKCRVCYHKFIDEPKKDY